MKRKLHLPKLSLIALFAFLFLGVYNIEAQVGRDFAERFETQVRGDLTMIANSSINRSGNRPFDDPGPANEGYDGTQNNHSNSVNMQYIDVDSDPSTFSSSSADLIFPTAEFGTSSECFNVVYAGLYWSGMKGRTGDNSGSNDAIEDNEDVQTVRLMVPGSATYTDVTATNANSFISNGSFNSRKPYACYADITSIVTSLADAGGTYTIANVKGFTGTDGGGGGAAGWIMVVVFENPSMPGRYISTFDGFVFAENGNAAADPIDFPVSGFTTVPAPFPVNAKVGVGIIEGDRGLVGGGDSMWIKANSTPATGPNGGFTRIGDPNFATSGLNNPTNFFDSSITNNWNNVTTRNPNGSNSLGIDADLFEIDNSVNGFNSVIPNNETGVQIELRTDGERYGAFLSTFSVEIIEPNIQMVKTVEGINEDGDLEDITGGNVNLGDEIFYVIEFQNIGNDDAVNLTIRDDLPANVTYDAAMNSMIVPSGMPTPTYDPATHSILFTVPNNLVPEGQPLPQEIRFSVNVVADCFELRDACSNEIQNQAFATYSGVFNNNVISDDPSFYGFDDCDFGIPGASNFIANIDDCNFERDEVLCGSSVTISGADGYDTYQWYTDLVFTTDPVTGRSRIDTSASTILPGENNQTLVVTALGQYGVVQTAPAPC